MPATRTRTAAAAAALGAAALLGCVDPGVAFRCLSSDDCRDGARAGTCERETRFCSFPDVACAGTGRRYAPWSGEYARRCVPPGAADAGPRDAAADANAAPDAAALCADEGQPCCDGTSCYFHLLCIGGTCRNGNVCGTRHMPCCPGNTCDTGLACECQGGTGCQCRLP